MSGSSGSEEGVSGGDGEAGGGQHGHCLCPCGQGVTKEGVKMVPMPMGVKVVYISNRNKEVQR